GMRQVRHPGKAVDMLRLDLGQLGFEVGHPGLERGRRVDHRLALVRRRLPDRLRRVLLLRARLVDLGDEAASPFVEAAQREEVVTVVAAAGESGGDRLAVGAELAQIEHVTEANREPRTARAAAAGQPPYVPSRWMRPRHSATQAVASR